MIPNRTISCFMIYRIFVIILLNFFCISSFSQEIKKINTDSIYFKALSLYKNKEYRVSLNYTDRGLELAPEYHDIRILRIRNYWALEKIDKAGDDLRFLLKEAKDYPSVKELAIRQANYLREPATALAYINNLERFYEPDDKLKVLKASLFLKNGERKEAREIALSLFNQDIGNDLRYTLQNILNRTVSNEIGLNYQYINFSEDYSRNSPWNTVSGEFLHYFKRTALIGRVTYTDRSYDQSYLYEIESYPVFSEKVYGFLNAGISDGSLFPDFRGSASVFINFLKILELEAGGRLLHFSEQDYFTGILGLTAYQGRFYLNARSFLGPERLNQLIQNYQFNIRYYFSDTDNYLFGRLGSGISPDERTIFTQVQNNPGLEAYYFTAGINKTLGTNHIFQLTGGYLVEDLSNGNKGNQFIGNIGYRFRF